MSYVRKSLRIKSPFGEFGDPPLPRDSKIIFEEEFSRKKSNGKQEKSIIQNDDKYSKKNELIHADFIQRLIIEASDNKRQRRLSNLSNDNSSHMDKLLQDENNDWFFEKILEKFENIRSRKSHQYARSTSNDFNNDRIYGVERIVERRYYVKKPNLASQHSKLTSTSDLTKYSKKIRQISGTSSATLMSITCSQCSSSTIPTYVENLRDQSDALRNEISELKTEIEQLQTSQQEFFQQLKTQLQLKTNLTTSQNFALPTISPIQLSSERNETFGNVLKSFDTNKKVHSISTESLASSSEASSGNTTPTPESPAKPSAAPSSVPVAPRQPLISEFIATKNPSIPPFNAYVSSKSSSVVPTPPINLSKDLKPSSVVSTPPINSSKDSKPSSVVPTPPINSFKDSKPSSVQLTPPVNAHVNSKSPSVSSTPQVNEDVDSKHRSLPSTPQVNEDVDSKHRSLPSTPQVNEDVDSKHRSLPSTPPITEFIAPRKAVIPRAPPLMSPIESDSSRASSVTPTPPAASLPRSSARIPTYENELAHRRALSPRSQIVASSASIQDSSDSSSGSTSPEIIHSNPQKISKVPVTTLRNNDLQNLIQYSSQLEVSGFPPSKTPVINNPNTSSTFWESVDQYIENTRTGNIRTGLSSIPQSNNGNIFGFNNHTTKQLDKYDLEIKPRGIIESSAPLLMPPLDILP